MGSHSRERPNFLMTWCSSSVPSGETTFVGFTPPRSTAFLDFSCATIWVQNAVVLPHSSAARVCVCVCKSIILRMAWRPEESPVGLFYYRRGDVMSV